MKINKKYSEILFGVLVSLVMSLMISFILTLINMDFASNFFDIWFRGFILGFIVAFPTSMAIIPAVRKIVDKLTSDWLSDISGNLVDKNSNSWRGEINGKWILVHEEELICLLLLQFRIKLMTQISCITKLLYNRTVIPVEEIIKKAEKDGELTPSWKKLRERGVEYLEEN